MAADDDDRKPEPDPWADIVADGLGEADASEAFSFDAEPAASAPVNDAVVESAAEAQPSGEADVEDGLVEEWLTGGDEATTAGDDAGPGSLFPADDAAPGSSHIDIGTGLSGIDGDAAAASGDEAVGFGGDAFEAPPATDEFPVIEPVADESTDAVVAGEDGASGFPGLTVPVVTASAASVTSGTRRPAPAKRASGGIGQMIGIVLGGLAAIPITLGILIWGLQKDPFGVAKALPPSVAFLLPQKLRPGARKPKATPANLAGAATLDDVSAMALPSLPEPDAGAAVEPAAAEPAPESPLDATAQAGDEPPAEPANEPAVDASPAPDAAVAVEPPAEGLPVFPDASPADEPPSAPPAADAQPAEGSAAVSTEAPAAVSADGLAAVEPAPTLDDFLETPPRVAEPPVVAAPAPPPLDLSGLDEAVADATALGEAVAVADQADESAYKRLLVQWYRSLTQVAEQLVAVERAAADSGRALDATPDQVAVLHAGIAGRDAQSAALARIAADWLDYSRRGGDGIVVPVVLQSVRRVGPYWSTKATVERSDGSARTVSIISRSEPVAAVGDALLVTGVLLEDGVIWAADCRPAGATADAAKPF